MPPPIWSGVSGIWPDIRPDMDPVGATKFDGFSQLQYIEAK